MEWFECWSCGYNFQVTATTLCHYKPVGSVVSHDVCPECWEKLDAARDED